MTGKTVQSTQERLIRADLKMSPAFGRMVREIDAAWPGSHTRCMYDSLSKRQASVLAQFRTNMTPLNGYLRMIKA